MINPDVPADPAYDDTFVFHPRRVVTAATPIGQSDAALPVSVLYQTHEDAATVVTPPTDERGPGQPRTREEKLLDAEEAKQLADKAASVMGKLKASIGEVTGLNKPGDAPEFKPQHRDLDEEERRGLALLGGIVVGGLGLSWLFTGQKKAKKASK